MQNPRLASRYAKSLIDLANEQNSLEAVLKDMRLVHGICMASSEFTIMLRSPIIKGDKKMDVINAVIANRGMNALTVAFIGLLVNKGREMNLPDIAEAFINAYNEMKRIRTVKLTTAKALPEAVKQNITSKVAAYMPDDTLNVESVVDESLIGGFVLEVGDKLFDASVKRSLAEMRARITDTSYVSKM
jgi:F-type H+-transporting ATPase subunit delta